MVAFVGPGEPSVAAIERPAVEPARIAAVLAVTLGSAKECAPGAVLEFIRPPAAQLGDLALDAVVTMVPPPSYRMIRCRVRAGPRARRRRRRPESSPRRCRSGVVGVEGRGPIGYLRVGNFLPRKSFPKPGPHAPARPGFSSRGHGSFHPIGCEPLDFAFRNERATENVDELDLALAGQLVDCRPANAERAASVVDAARFRGVGRRTPLLGAG